MKTRKSAFLGSRNWLTGGVQTLVLVLGLSSVTQAQISQAVSGVVTDFNNGVWVSSAAALNAVKPNNSHNLLAFTFKTKTYSTSANDGLLTANTISFIPGNYRALPVSNRTGTVNGNTKVGLGALYDGVIAGKSTPSPENNLNKYLTDGLKGLDMGTCIANLPTGTIVFPTSNLKVASIGDGIPDILVTQVADPTAGSYDRYQFVDNNGAVVGNYMDIILNDIPAIGNWTADFYEASTNPMTLGAGYTATDRPIRLWAADFSDFGITADNHGNIANFRINLNGNSDAAFIAYNVNAFESESSANQPLPVSLVSFTGKTQQNHTILNWQTASEKNNDRFEIEFSNNGKAFEKVGTVAGHGSTSSFQHYTFKHQVGNAGLAYYRLKQVDLDGTFEYSPVITVMLSNLVPKMTLYPNPAQEAVTISHQPASGNELLQVLDLTGKIVFSQRIAENAKETKLKTTGLPKGFYQVILQSGAGTTTQKLILE